jgi:membrane protease YdiL (CAAX protease family)
MSVRAFVQAHPLAVYLFLAFALSWWPWPFKLMNPASAPMLPWGPLIGALFVVGIAYGRAGLMRILRATFRWRVHPIWYVIALLGPIMLWGVPALVVALGGNPPDTALLSDFVLWPVTLIVFGIVQGPLTEEPGWRGLALPLMLRRLSPLVSSVIIGAIWFAWHLPLIIGDTSGQRPVVPYATFIVAQSVMLTGIYLGTRGSVFLVIIFHAAVNATGSHLMPAFSAPARDTIWLLFAALNVAIAVAVALLPAFRRPELDRIEAAPYERSNGERTDMVRTDTRLDASTA